MEILLDSADPSEVAEVAAHGLIAGITTNPSLYARQAKGVPLTERLGELLDVSPGYVFTQVIGLDDRESMMRQARWLRQRSDRIVVKLPMTIAGIDSVRALKREDPSIQLSVTAVSSVAQAMIAAMAGADIVSVFNGPLDTVQDVSVEIVAPIKSILRSSGLETRVLSCGRFPRGVGEYAAAGTDMVTLRREFLDLAYEHPYTDKRLSGFRQDWEAAFGDATWPAA